MRQASSSVVNQCPGPDRPHSVHVLVHSIVLVEEATNEEVDEWNVIKKAKKTNLSCQGKMTGGGFQASKVSDSLYLVWMMLWRMTSEIWQSYLGEMVPLVDGYTE